MAGILSKFVAPFASLISLMRQAFSYMYETFVVWDESQIPPVESSTETEPPPSLVETSMETETPTSPLVRTSSSSSSPPLSDDHLKRDDIFAIAPDGSLTLIVDTTEAKMGHIAMLKLGSGFQAVLNHFEEPVPNSWKSEDNNSNRRNLHALKVAIRQNRRFLKEKPFTLLLTSIPFVLSLISSKKDIEFLREFNFTLGYVSRKNAPDILSGGQNMFF